MYFLLAVAAKRLTIVLTPKSRGFDSSCSIFDSSGNSFDSVDRSLYSCGSCYKKQAQESLAAAMILSGIITS